MAEYLTVGQLREKIAGIDDNVVVAVSCENRCEPHPVTNGYFVPVNKELRSRLGDYSVGDITVIELWQNESADLSTKYEDEDGE